MYRTKAKPGHHVVDNRHIRTDSMMELAIIKRLIDHGFSGKWRRPRGGIAY